MTGVWFSYGPDSPALIESIASFRDAGGKHVAIFDEKRDPIPDAVIELISPDYRESTSYNRGGNLRGWDNLFGQLDAFERAAGIFGSDGVVKIDSDTVICDLDWIDPAAPMSGFMAGAEAYLFGLAYHIRIDAVRAIRDSMQNRYRSSKDKIAEDRGLSCEAFWLFGPSVHVVGWQERRAGGWEYGRTPFRQYRNCAAVTFGNRAMIPGPGKPCEKKEIMAVEMAKFRKAISCSAPSPV